MPQRNNRDIPQIILNKFRMEIKRKMETLLSSETKTVTIDADGPFTINGVNISLGASNVSFGLLERHAINQVFLSLAIAAGATCAITDPMKLSMTICAVNFFAWTRRLCGSLRQALQEAGGGKRVIDDSP